MVDTPPNPSCARGVWGASLRPPDPVRELSAHLLRATAELTPLPRWLEQHPLAALSPSARQLAWRLARTVTMNPDHGFDIAERVPADSVGWLWQVFIAAPTLAALHERYPAFAALLLDELCCHVLPTARSIVLRLTPASRVKVDRAEQDFRAAMQLKIWRALTGESALSLLSAHFTYPRPASTQRHEKLLGTHALCFSQPHFQLELARSWWETPLPTRHPERFAQLCAQAKEEAEHYQDVALPTQVETLITCLLSRDARAETVAKVFGMSARTLRRRLAESGQPFRTLLEQARLRQAALLEEVAERVGASVVSQRERARLLGFANTGALRNARQRWRTCKADRN